jgi:hypothetical protein
MSKQEMSTALPERMAVGSDPRDTCYRYPDGSEIRQTVFGKWRAYLPGGDVLHEGNDPDEATRTFDCPEDGAAALFDLGFGPKSMENRLQEEEGAGMNDNDWKRLWAGVTDPSEALRQLVAHETVLGYDPYYADLKKALLEMAERCSQGRPLPDPDVRKEPLTQPWEGRLQVGSYGVRRGVGRLVVSGGYHNKEYVNMAFDITDGKNVWLDFDRENAVLLIHRVALALQLKATLTTMSDEEFKRRRR